MASAERVPTTTYSRGRYAKIFRSRAKTLSAVQDSIEIAIFAGENAIRDQQKFLQ